MFHRLTRRAFLATAAGVAIGASAGAQTARETLYNGIVLPQPWPPRRQQLSPTAVRPPYLSSPPGVISIDVGRQLFVDDFLIEEMRGCALRLARPERREIAFTADAPWEDWAFFGNSVVQ
ncbi:MAG TPA: hypothetical protein VF239_11870, partial [Vicinamibacterales bacterium]